MAEIRQPPVDITKAHMGRDCARHAGPAPVDGILTVLEVVHVDLDILSFVCWNRTLLEDGANWARRLAGAAVDTLIRIDEELLHVFVVAFTFSGVNTVHWTDIDTRAIFKTHTGAGNHVRHRRNHLLIRLFRILANLPPKGFSAAHLDTLQAIQRTGSATGQIASYNDSRINSHEPDVYAAVSALIIPI